MRLSTVGTGTGISDLPQVPGMGASDGRLPPTAREPAPNRLEILPITMRLRCLKNLPKYMD